MTEVNDNDSDSDYTNDYSFIIPAGKFGDCFFLDRHLYKDIPFTHLWKSYKGSPYKSERKSNIRSKIWAIQRQRQKNKQT